MREWWINTQIRIPHYKVHLTPGERLYACRAIYLLRRYPLIFLPASVCGTLKLAVYSYWKNSTNILHAACFQYKRSYVDNSSQFMQPAETRPNFVQGDHLMRMQAVVLQSAEIPGDLILCSARWSVACCALPVGQ